MCARVLTCLIVRVNCDARLAMRAVKCLKTWLMSVLQLLNGPSAVTLGLFENYIVLMLMAEPVKI